MCSATSRTSHCVGNAVSEGSDVWTHWCTLNATGESERGDIVCPFNDYGPKASLCDSPELLRNPITITLYSTCQIHLLTSDWCLKSSTLTRLICQISFCIFWLPVLPAENDRESDAFQNSFFEELCTAYTIQGKVSTNALKTSILLKFLCDSTWRKTGIR